MISRDRDYGLSAYGDHLGIGGTDGQPGKLVFLHGDSDDPAQLQTGRTEVGRWTWNQLVFVRNGDDVRVYLNGNPEPEIDITSPVELPTGFDQLFLGGRSDRSSNWEGRLDDIAVFDRALDADEIEIMSEVEASASDEEGPEKVVVADYQIVVVCCHHYSICPTFYRHKHCASEKGDRSVSRRFL